ncbi:MAG: Amino acid/amide transporter substrate-binding protein family [Herbaspirillum sp.]|jgi:branched-chain amino acid transport system substrate-binding protein|nr:Amino acid/amide transporter substrate-binding protein family [Herbaspirillum sp.]
MQLISKFTFYRTAIALAAMVTINGYAQSVASCPSPIPIALTTPLTSGVALLGIQAKLGLEDAVEEINAAGGIGGKKIKLSIEDATGSSTNALNSLNRLLEDKPVALFSSMISPHIFTENDTIKQAGVPVFTTGTNGALMKQNNPWLIRIHVHDGQLADALPRYVAETLKKQRPAILTVSDDYGLGAAKGLQAAFDKLKIKTVAVESYGLNDKDMSAQLTKIRSANADMLILFGRPGDVALVMKQRKALGIAIPVIGNSSAVAATTLANLTAEEADGSIGIGGMFPQVTADPKSQAFAKRVLDRSKIPADNFAVAYRDGMYMLKTAIEKVGCDHARIRDELRSTKDWKGLLITYVADKDGDLAHTMGVYRNKGKTTELIGTIKEPGF